MAHHANSNINKLNAFSSQEEEEETPSEQNRTSKRSKRMVVSSIEIEDTPRSPVGEVQKDSVGGPPKMTGQRREHTQTTTHQKYFGRSHSQKTDSLRIPDLPPPRQHCKRSGAVDAGLKMRDGERERDRDGRQSSSGKRRNKRRKSVVKSEDAPPSSRRSRSARRRERRQLKHARGNSGISSKTPDPKSFRHASRHGSRSRASCTELFAEFATKHQRSDPIDGGSPDNNLGYEIARGRRGSPASDDRKERERHGDKNLESNGTAHSRSPDNRQDNGSKRMMGKKKTRVVKKGDLGGQRDNRQDAESMQNSTHQSRRRRSVGTSRSAARESKGMYTKRHRRRSVGTSSSRARSRGHASSSRRGRLRARSPAPPSMEEFQEFTRAYWIKRMDVQQDMVRMMMNTQAAMADNQTAVLRDRFAADRKDFEAATNGVFKLAGWGLADGSGDFEEDCGGEEEFEWLADDDDDDGFLPKETFDEDEDNMSESPSSCEFDDDDDDEAVYEKTGFERRDSNDVENEDADDNGDGGHGFVVRKAVDKE